MNFKRHDNPLRTLKIGKSVLDELIEHPICRSINDPRKDVDDPRNFDRVWINPHQQFSFHSTWCTEQDLRDWMNGTGIMVRGNTPEEKKKYWDYAVFEGGDDFGGFRWLIKYTWKWFDKFVTDFQPHNHDGYGLSTQIKKPLKIKNPRTRDRLENERREEEIIIAMYAPYINEIVSDLEYSEFKNIRYRLEKEFYGIKRTLYCLGVGYMAACNTPEDIRNLSWVTDIVYAKALYLHFKKIGMDLPDFEWLNNRNHYDD